MDKNECCSYVMSLKKPTAVQFAVVGNFRSTNELDMVMARINRIEYFMVTAEGLNPHKEIPIFGRIASMNAFRLPGEKLDSLLVLTAKYHLAILEFDSNGNPKTRASGHVADKVGRPAETGIFISVHESGLIGLRLYEGHLKLIQWQDGKDLKNFNVRFEDYSVTDVAFLQNTEQPTVAYVYQNLNGRHLKVCEIDLESRELRPAVWHQSNIEAEATLLIPIPAPYGGLVVVGQESISYQKNQNHFISVAPPLINTARFNCYGRIDRTGERFLLGDISGRLFMLLLIKDIKENCEEIRDLKIELLGEISIPECIVYLDNSVAFIGSKLGDSQLIRLTTEPVDINPSSFVEYMDIFPNLGPIRDLALMDVDGQNQLVCASGAFKDGSLRIIRSGIGINEMGTVELSGIKEIFTLQIDSDLDNYLVISFADVTHLFLIDHDELEDTKIADFDLSKPTLWAGNISPSRIIQINADCVQMISGDGKFSTKWSAPSCISLATANPKSGQILVASGADLFYLRVQSDELVQIGQIEFANEIACLDISPLGNLPQSNIFALGFWVEQTVGVYSIGSNRIHQLCKEELTSEFLPRSLLMISMEDAYYLFVALGDGSVIRFIVHPETGLLTDQKKFALGTVPTYLRKFISKKQAVNVFVCSDRPTVIYSNNHKLSFCNVNLRNVRQMCPLNSKYYRNCLALSDGENLILGTIDDIQKLHIRTVHLRESVSRVVYEKEMKIIAVLTSQFVDNVANGVHRMINRPSISIVGAKHNAQQQQAYSSSFASTNTTISQQQEMVCTGIDTEVHSICFLDANTFECLQVHELNKQEIGLSLCIAKLGNDSIPYFAVGTSVTVPDETESKQGRILIIQASYVDSSDAGIKIRIITEKEVKGAVYSITTLDNKLICTVNSTVRLFEWTPERELHLECSNFNYIQALYLKTKGDLVLVGDLMRSICLLSYKSVDSSFEEIARDYSAEWTTACEIVNSETFIAAETNYNIYCCKTDVNAETDEEKMRLKQVGYYYLGEQINVFQRGSIGSTQQRDSSKELKFKNPIIYGTADGGLGAILQLPHYIFMFLQDLQNRIATKTHNCTRVDHSVHRSFFSERRLEAAAGFLDGDLIQTVVEIPRELLLKIIDGMKLWKADGEVEQDVTPEDVLKLIEDLARIY